MRALAHTPFVSVSCGGDARPRRCRARGAACGGGSCRRCAAPGAGTTSSTSSSSWASTVRRTPDEEGAIGTRRSPLRPGDDRLGLQRHERRRHVRRGRGVAEVAAHGGQVANLHGAHQGAALGQSTDSPGARRACSSSSRAVTAAPMRSPWRVALRRRSGREAGQVDDAGGLEQASSSSGAADRCPRPRAWRRPRAGRGSSTHISTLSGHGELESSHAGSPGTR